MTRHIAQTDLFRVKVAPPDATDEPPLPPKHERDRAYAGWLRDGSPWPPGPPPGVLSGALDACAAGARYRSWG